MVIILTCVHMSLGNGLLALIYCGITVAVQKQKQVYYLNDNSWSEQKLFHSIYTSRSTTHLSNKHYDTIR